MHAIQSQELLITPDNEYVPMKPQYPHSTTSNDSTEEGAMRLALGEDVALPPFQPMPPHQTQSPEPLQPEIQSQPAESHQHMTTNYPQDQVHHPESLRNELPHAHSVKVDVDFASSDVDMYTEDGGYDQKMHTDPWQLPAVRQPDQYQTQVQQQGYWREEHRLDDHEGSSQVDRLQQMLPDVSEVDIRTMLTLSNWDVQESFQRIRINQMLELELEGSTPEKCRRALEHCRWKIDRAAAWLMDNSG